MLQMEKQSHFFALFFDLTTLVFPYPSSAPYHEQDVSPGQNAPEPNLMPAGALPLTRVARRGSRTVAPV